MNALNKIKKRKLITSLSVLALSVLMLVLIPFESLGSTKWFTMPTNGMRPTIVAGDRVRADIEAYDSHSPELEDLAIFVPVGKPEARWVFRIAGVPGDVFVYEDDVLKRNGEAVVSPAFEGLKTFGPVEVPGGPFGGNKVVLGDDEYFFLSDDPDHYNDSRAWGAVPRANILGKILSHE